MRFHSITEIEDYIRDIIGISYVNLEGIDIEVCNVIVDTLEEFFSLYPLFKKSIVTIGQSKYMEEQANLICLLDNNVTDDGVENFVWVNYVSPFDSVWMSSIAAKDKNNLLIYFGLNLSNYICNNSLSTLDINCRKEAITGFHSPNCNTLKSAIYHEFGHLFDHILKITDNPKFFELLKNMDIEHDISRYATTNVMDSFAEAFAEYHSTNTPNETVKKIVEFGLAEYNLRAEKKSEIFDVSRKFR